MVELLVFAANKAEELRDSAATDDLRKVYAHILNELHSLISIADKAAKVEASK